MREDQKKFLKLNFSLFVPPFLLFALSVFALPSIFQVDPREQTEELTGHFKTLRLVKGGPQETGIEFTIKERPEVFAALGMRETDRTIFAAVEKLGNETKFIVQKDLLQTASLKRIPVLYFATEKDVYLKSDNIKEIMNTSRGVAMFVTLVSLGIAIWLTRRIQEKYRRDSHSKLPNEYDPLLILVAQHPKLSALPLAVIFFSLSWSILPSGWWWIGLSISVIGYGAFLRWYSSKKKDLLWLNDALEYEKDRLQKKAVRTATSAPKHVKAVQLLLKSGVDLNIRNSSGQTALHIAAALGSVEALDLLIRSGADLNPVDNNGDTPLILAAKNNSTAIVTRLLDKGADVLIKNLENQTALVCTEAEKAKNEGLYKVVLRATETALAKKEEEAQKAAAATIEEIQNKLSKKD